MTIDEIVQLTSITPFFLEKIKNIVDLEKHLAAAPDSNDEILLAKSYGFSNTEIVQITGKHPEEIEDIVGTPFLQDGRYLCCRVPGKHPVFLLHV